MIISSPYKRLDIEKAIDEIIGRGDGIAFQRLARRLFRGQFGTLVPHAERKDEGRDASVVFQSGTIAFCASITASLTKIRKDIHSLLKRAPSGNDVIFCTPRSVSNQLISRWKSSILKELKIRLHVFERTWVVDECLRASNAHIIAEELHLFPSGDKTTSQYLFDHVITLSLPTCNITCASCATHRNRAYVVWSMFDYEERLDVTTLEVIEHGETNAIHISNGADPSVVGVNESVYVSWILKNPNRNDRWAIWISALDEASQLSHLCVEKSAALAWPPSLYNYHNRLICCYVYYRKKGKPILRISTWPEGNHQDIELQSDKVFGLQISCTRDKVYAAVKLREEIQLLEFADGRWSFLTSLFQDINFARWSFAVSRNMCYFILEAIGNWSLYTYTCDLAHYQSNGLWPLTAYGKFPAIAGTDSGVYAAWVGTPAPPIELQGTYCEQTCWELHERYGKEILMKDEELFSRAVGILGEVERERLLTDIGWKVGVMTPLWIGELDEGGRCVYASGPLGRDSRENWGCELSVCGDRGLLTWRTGVYPYEKYEQCAREFIRLTS